MNVEIVLNSKRVAGRQLLAAALVLSLISTPVLAQDLRIFGISKGASYFQLTSDTPPDSGATYVFRAWVSPADPGAVLDGSVLPPGELDPYWLEFGDPPEPLEFIADYYDTEAGLNLDFPDGDYVLEVETRSMGWQALTLGLSGRDYPPTPTLTDLETLQEANPDADLKIAWNPFTGPGLQDSIQVVVSDYLWGRVVFQTPSPGSAGALGATQASVTVPAGLLEPEAVYTVTVTFHRIATRDTTQLSGALGLGLFAKSTSALITTAAGGDDIIPPVLMESEPANGVGKVDENRAIRFVFSEPMQPAISIGWMPALAPARFSYEWSADQRTLLCTPLESLPQGTDILWTLNPSIQPLQFRDLAGNPLPADVYRGSFQTGGEGSTGGPAKDPPRLELNLSGNPTVDPVTLLAASQNLRGFLVQASVDLIDWVTIATIEFPMTSFELPVAGPTSDPHVFYRATAYGLTSDVGLELDRTVQARVARAGGVLETTGSDGTTYTLTVPEGALLSPTVISMTPVRTIVPSPFDQGLTAAVQLEPEGLTLWHAADLIVTTPTSVNPTNLIGITYEGEGLNTGYYPLTLTGSHTLSLQLTHFSGYGAGRASAEKRESLPQACDAQREMEEALAATMSQAAERQRRGEDDSQEQATAEQVLRDHYTNSVFPNLERAVEDDTVLDCAIHDFVSWSATMQAYGFEEVLDPPAEVRSGILNAIDKAQARCAQESDLTAAPRMLELAAVAMALGLESGDFGTDILERVRQCLQFKLQFFSEISWSEEPAALAGRSLVRALEVPLQLADSMTHLEGTGTLDYVTYEYSDIFCDQLQDFQGHPSELNVLFGYIAPRLRSTDCRCNRQPSEPSTDEESEKEIEVLLVVELGSPHESVYYPPACGFISDEVVQSCHWLDAVDDLHKEEIIEELSQRPPEACPAFALQFDNFLSRGTDFSGLRKVAEKRYVRTLRVPEDPLLPGVRYVEETILEIFHTPSR